jgi:hypothetical protein
MLKISDPAELFLTLETLDLAGLLLMLSTLVLLRCRPRLDSVVLTGAFDIVGGVGDFTGSFVLVGWQWSAFT